jgi:soluble lytic murein transglycosylase-like protein
MKNVICSALVLAIALTPVAGRAGSDVDSLIAAADGYAKLVSRINSLPMPAAANQPWAPFQPATFQRDPILPTIYASPRRAPARNAGNPPYSNEVRAAAKRNGVSSALLFAVVETESNFDPNAVSPKGARGLGQVMPMTARDMGISPARLWHPEANLEASARYIRWLGDRYGRDLDRVLVGYNAGPAVADGQRQVPAETRHYTVKVKESYRKYRIRENEKGDRP